MKKNSEYIKFLFIGFCAILIAYFSPFVIPSKILFSINDLSYGYTYYFSRKFIKPFKLVGIAIDDASLSKIPQRRPWKRSIYAKLIEILDKEKVNTIGIDIAFEAESEDKKEDAILKDTLESVSSRIILAHRFDPKEEVPILPLPQFREFSYSIGMINTPQDEDSLIRRLRGYIKLKDDFYYSFPVEMAASFLNKKPEEIVSFLPLLKDKSFYINYLLKPKDIIRVSFYDVLENLEELKKKKQYGNDFLNDALVLIYSEAEIIHDISPTPLGRMPGGLLHLNGVADIISKRFIRQILIGQIDILCVLFLIFSFLFIFYLLRSYGFVLGSLLTFGVLIFNFWCLIFLSLKGIKFDFSRIVIFCLLFFMAGSLYKYIYFLTELLKIKDKATLDPLRGLFTLRYFYYRLELELKKIYLRKDLFLVLIYLESFKEVTETIPLERQKNLWQEISSIISLKKSFWSVYSQEELIGCIVSQPFKIKFSVYSLKNNLGAIFKDSDIKPKVKLGYLRLKKKEYPIRELLYVLSNELKKKEEEIILFKDSDLVDLIGSSKLRVKEGAKFLESLDEDIEEKNRQLLLLIENLNKEHAKTKESFFQIIASLVNALEARDPYTQGHSERICSYALKIAGKLGWDNEEKEKLKKASLLHDLGKIGIPDKILHKTGPLDNEEFDFIKKHELIAVRILEPLKEINEILPWIMYHHERWDGKGYPHGLGGNAIPLASQIIALADVFDALTTGRDYKEAFRYDEAIQEVIKNKGTQFNPQLADIFVEVITENYIQQ